MCLMTFRYNTGVPNTWSADCFWHRAAKRIFPSANAFFHVQYKRSIHCLCHAESRLRLGVAGRENVYGTFDER